MSTEPGVAVLVEITSSANEPVLVPADLGRSQAAAEGPAVVRHSPEPGGGGRAFASNRQKEVIMTHMSTTTAAVGPGRGAARSSRSGRAAGKPDRHSDRSHCRRGRPPPLAMEESPAFLAGAIRDGMHAVAARMPESQFSPHHWQ